MPKAKKGWSKKGVTQENMSRKIEEKDVSFSGKSYLQEGLLGLEMFIPHDGENCIRIIEPMEVEELGFYALTVRFHRNVGQDQDYFLCNKWMRARYGKRFLGGCFIDEQQTSELWDEDPDLAKTYYPEPQRELMLVLDLKGDDPAQVMLFSCPKTLAEDFIGQSKRKDSDVYVDVSDPEEGVSIYFDRTGKGRNTKYKNVQLGKNLPLDDVIADARVPLFDLLVKPTYDEVKTAFLNTGDAETTPKYEEEPAEEAGKEAEEVTEDEFTNMDRTQLKKLIKEADSAFVVYKSTSDDDLRDKLRSLVEPSDERAENEEPEEPEKDDGNDGDADDIKAKLRAAIQKRAKK
jgi:hypothetical protein